MILLCLVTIPLLAGFLAWATGRWSPVLSRTISLVALLLNLALTMSIWLRHSEGLQFVHRQRWLEEFRIEWIPRFGVSVHFGLDGLSLALLLLTFLLGALGVLASWSEVKKHVGFFHFNLLWVLAGVTGVFLSLDLFLFYFFWEVMLIPMVFLIGIWGHENRRYAAIKFFLFTQAGGLLMLVSIIGLFFANLNATGRPSFDYMDFLGVSLDSTTAMLLMLGFFIAFAVKIPLVPLHTWLPDAHTQAPTAGSVILAGLLLKTGGYGLIRFVVPLFPVAAYRFGPIAMALGVFGILYGALLAFAQSDLKRLIAYTSISHLGFVVLGVFAWNRLALQGAIIQMICHGLSAAALFILVGQLYERTHTRDLNNLGGLWERVPRMGAMALFFSMASLGLPGIGNFIGEFLTLLGTYQVDPFFTAAAAVGLISSAIYSLAMLQRAFFGPNTQGWSFPDLNFREVVVLGVLVASLVGIGIYPQKLLETTNGALSHIEQAIQIQARLGE